MVHVCTLQMHTMYNHTYTTCRTWYVFVCVQGHRNPLKISKYNVEGLFGYKQVSSLSHALAIPSLSCSLSVFPPLPARAVNLSSYKNTPIAHARTRQPSLILPLPLRGYFKRIFVFLNNFKDLRMTHSPFCNKEFLSFPLSHTLLYSLTLTFTLSLKIKQKDAAEELGLSITALKKVCRKFGIARCVHVCVCIRVCRCVLVCGRVRTSEYVTLLC